MRARVERVAGGEADRFGVEVLDHRVVAGGHAEAVGRAAQGGGRLVVRRRSAPAGRSRSTSEVTPSGSIAAASSMVRVE